MNATAFRYRAAFLPLLFSSLLGLATQCQPKASDDPTPTTPTPEPVNAAWKELPPMHEPRYDGSAVTLLDGKVLVCGGKNIDGKGGIVGTELYDPATNTWEKLIAGEKISVSAPELLRLRNGDVVAFGGSFDIGRVNGTSSMVWRFTAATRQWRYVGQLGFLTGVGEQQQLAAGVELRDGRVALAGSNKIAILDGHTLRNYYTQGWGTAVYEGTIMWALPNNHFRALFTGRSAPNISYLANEYDPDLDDRTNPPGADFVRNWYPNAAYMSHALLNDSTLLVMGGHAGAIVANTGYNPTLVNLRTGATTELPPVPGKLRLRLHKFSTVIRPLADGRWVVFSPDHSVCLALNVQTRQWESYVDAPADAPNLTGWEGSVSNIGHTSFATLLRNDDLFTTGLGHNYIIRKK